MYHNDRKGGFENEKNLQTNYRPSYADSGFVHLGLCWADILLRNFVPFGQRACFIPWGSGSAYILCQERSDSTDHCVPSQPYGHPLDCGLGTGKAPEFVPRTERDIIECSVVIMHRSFNLQESKDLAAVRLMPLHIGKRPTVRTAIDQIIAK